MAAMRAPDRAVAVAAAGLTARSFDLGCAFQQRRRERRKWRQLAVGAQPPSVAVAAAARGDGRGDHRQLLPVTSSGSVVGYGGNGGSGGGTHLGGGASRERGTGGTAFTSTGIAIPWVSTHHQRRPGGAGGAAPGASFNFANGGAGGAGGAGVTGSGMTITNSGTISGGNGGTGGIGSTANGGAGAGGAGIVGSDLTIINGGAITGGLSGDGTTLANAMTFTGGANTLQAAVRLQCRRQHRC